jgi:anti-sigma regulatory factor (Ser/Thr protein kinase)
MSSKKITLVIGSEYVHVPLVSSAVRSFCTQIPLSDKDAYGIELCVTEAVVNSIKHAYGEKPGNNVTVLFTFHRNELMLEVCDSGRSMDPGLLAKRKHLAIKFDPLKIETIPESGRGLTIIQGFMDDVTYTVNEDSNCLRMIKRIV